MANSGTFTTNTTVEVDAQGVGGGQPFHALAASGTWGGATVKVQAGYYLGGASTLTWFDVPSASLTANGVLNFAVAADRLRVSCSGGTAQNIAWSVR